MNKHILTGTLGKDAEVKEFNNGNTVINFPVAHKETWKDKQGQKQERTTWHECEWFINNTSIAQYLKKGAKVLVEGTPYSRAYINQQNQAIGINVTRVNNLEITKFVETQNQQQNHPQQKAGFAPAPEPYNGGQPEDDGDGLPY